MQHSYTFSSFYIHSPFLYILTNIFILKVDKKHIILFTRVKLHKIIVLFTVLMSLLLPSVHNLLTFFLLHKPLSYAIIILSLTAKRPEARIYQGFQTFFNS